jgi:transcriptional regulator GlxA family with amidase domain
MNDDEAGGAVRVQVVLFDGFDPMDAVAPFETLAAPALIDGTKLDVELATAGEPGPVTAGAGGLILHATATIDVASADVIVFPGAAGPMNVEEGDPRSVPSRLAALLDTPLRDAAAQAIGDEGTIVAAVCGGSAFLAMAGLITGRNAVTHHLGMDLLDALGVNAVDARVVDDGDLVTAGGVTSGIDLGLHLVERFYGAPLAHQVERLIEHERRGVVWRRAGGGCHR